MAPDPLELLDRQHDRLQSRDGVEFVHELRRFYEFITAGPEAVTTALRELREDAERIEREFNEHDEALVPELVALREELVQLAPEADDSGMSRPQTVGAPSVAWTFSLANFDQVATNGADRLIQRAGWDNSRSGTLLRILENKLRSLQWMEREGPNPKVSETNLRPDLDDLARRVRNLADRHRHAAQAHSLAIETRGGFQVVYLDTAVAETNPQPREVISGEDEHAFMDEAFRRVAGGWHVMESAAGGRALTGNDHQMLDFQVKRLKPATEHVYEDLRMKLATAPPPPVPELGYFDRVKAWVRTPDYQLLGGACLSGLVSGLATGETEGLVVFAIGALLFAIVPPATRVRFSIGRDRASLAFIAMTCGAVVLAMVFSGFGLAVLTFAVLVAAFFLGQHNRR